MARLLLLLWCLAEVFSVGSVVVSVNGVTSSSLSPPDQSTSKFITGDLSLRFRKILTMLVHTHYFENMAYYKLSHVDGRVTNLEQRTASDIPRFCNELSELVQDDLSVVADALVYTWCLCSYPSPKYVFWILAYVLGAGVAIRNFTLAFGKLMSKEQQLEGEYRQLHSRLRSHAKSIAF